jgi:hypothetical protein
MTAVGYILFTEENVNASWSPYQYDSVAAFTLLENSSVPPALPAKETPGG